MICYRPFLLLLVLPLVSIGLTTPSDAAVQEAATDVAQVDAAPVDTVPVDFAKDILPILEKNCLECHGPDREENFRIDDRDSTMAYIEPEDAEGSELYEYLVSDDPETLMPPPAEGGPLADTQIALIKTWIDQGAKWPDDVEFKQPATPAISEDGPNNETPPAKKSMGERIWSAVGFLHPAAVHMPIGLLLAAGLFALLGLRGNFVMSDSAYYCLWLGMLTSIVATALGWSYAVSKGSGTDLQELWNTDSKFFLHRASGVAVTIFAILLSLYAARARALDPDDGFLWKLGAILLAIGVAYCGYEGGKLQYGEKHYNQLYSVIEDLTGWDIDGKPNEPAKDDADAGQKPGNKQDAGKENKSTDENSGVGKTSEESDPKTNPNEEANSTSSVIQ